MVYYASGDQFGLRVLLNELDTEPMRRLHPALPEMIECSIGRLFLAWNRMVNRDISTGAASPSPSRDMRRFEVIMGLWIVRTDAFLGQYQYELVEILDWLQLAGEHRHPWLENVDDLGRPKKLMKCRTVEALYQESLKCMRGRQSKRKSGHHLTAADERQVGEIGAGYTIVELLSPEALDVESERMRHCVGHGTYDAKLGTPGFHFFSIRDSEDRPHATVEMAPKLVDGQFTSVVRQIQGLRNTPVETHLVELFYSALDDILSDETPTVRSARAPAVGQF